MIVYIANTMDAARPKTLKRRRKHAPPLKDYQIDGYEGVKRGIYLGNRYSGEEEKPGAGGKLNLWSIYLLSLLSCINLLAIFPVFKMNLIPAYSSTAFIMVSGLIEKYSLFSKEYFFLGLTVFAFCLAPVSLYLFIRKNVLQNDLTAFLAVLFFILPTPFFNEGMQILSTILSGDGGHGVAFAFIPLILLAMQSYISSGRMLYGVVSAMGSAFVAVISPFAFFNLLIIFIILSVAEGFVSGFPMKLPRVSFLVLSSMALSFFWYYPNLMSQILTADHIAITYRRSLDILPVAIPVLPIAGTISFLVFDRKERLKPVFVAVALLLSYFIIYSISRTVNIAGIFTPGRYSVELAFAASFFFAFAASSVTQYFQKKYSFIKSNTFLFLLYGVVVLSLIAFVSYAVMISIDSMNASLLSKSVLEQYSAGFGNFERVFKAEDSSTLVAGALSLFTLFLLGALLIKSGISNRVTPQDTVS